MVLKFFLAFVYLFITFGVALVIGYDSRQLYFLCFLTLNQFLLSFILYLRSNISGLHFFKTDSVLSVLDRFIMIIICSFLLWGHITSRPFQIEWFVYAQTGAYLATALIAFIVVASKSEFVRLRYDRNFFIAILKQSLPFALLILLMAFYNRIDSVMLERMLPDGKEQSGIYAQSFRILDAAAMLGFLFAGLLLPIFSRMLKQKDSISQLTQFSFLLIIIPSLAFAVSSVFYSENIIGLLYHSHLDQSSEIFSILILGLISICSTYIFGTLLTANGSLKQLNIMAASGMLLNIVLNFILIPYYKAFGSAISSLVTQTVTATAQIIIATKIFRFKVNYKLLILLPVFTGFTILFGYLCSTWIRNWIAGYFLAAGASIILAFSLRLINLKAIYHLIRFNEE
jgi:O-antigen/teichoic acid export membrane protein